MINLGLQYEEIYPKIIVYKNTISDIDKLYNLVRKFESYSAGRFFMKEWTKWFVFGRYSSFKSFEEVLEDSYSHLSNCLYSASEKEAMLMLLKEESEFYNAIVLSNTFVLGHYISKFEVKLPPKSFMTTPNVAKYDCDIDYGRGKENRMAMQFHTDYLLGEWYWPDDAFLLTCTTYINDDYNGGEIVFLAGEDIIPYKPSAGDVIVFPSGSPLFPEKPNRQPYFHAVNSIKNKPKYFIRNYIKYPHAAEDLWIRNSEKYGDDWHAIAKERCEDHNLLTAEHSDGKPFDLDRWQNEKEVQFFGSNLINEFYDTQKDLYQINEKIYQYEEF